MKMRSVILVCVAGLALMSTGCEVADFVMNPEAVGIFGNQAIDQAERIGGQWVVVGGQLFNRIMGILGPVL